MEKKQTLSIETVGFATIPVETYNQMLIESATIKTLLTKAIAIKDGSRTTTDCGRARTFEGHH
jgi:hypothetical protein